MIQSLSNSTSSTYLCYAVSWFLVSASFLPPSSNVINYRLWFEKRTKGVHHARIDRCCLFPDRMWTMDWMKPSQGNLFLTVC